MAKVYAKVDNANRVTAIDSDRFIASLAGWTLVSEGEGDRFVLARQHYLDGELFNDDGKCLWKLSDGAIVARTAVEIAADPVARALTLGAERPLYTRDVYNGLDKSVEGFVLDARQGKQLRDGKVAKVPSATAGNFAELTLGGEIADSGKKTADFAAAAHTHSYAGASTPGGAATSALNCSGNAATATNASKLNGMSASDSGAWTAAYIPKVSASGGMEIGSYIDFHADPAALKDYDVRLSAADGGLIITGSTQGDFFAKSDKLIWISPAGNDTLGSGTSDAPWATVQHAVDMCPDVMGAHACTIKLAAGTYAGAAVSGKRLKLENAAGTGAIIGALTVANGSVVTLGSDLVLNGTLKISSCADVYATAGLAIRTDSAWAIEATYGGTFVMHPYSYLCLDATTGGIRAHSGGKVYAADIVPPEADAHVLTSAINADVGGTVTCKSSTLSGALTALAGGRIAVGSTYYPTA